MSIRIYNVAGRLVRTLVEVVDTPGRHEAQWDGRTDAGEMVTRGIYFVRSNIGGRTQSLRIIRLQ